MYSYLQDVNVQISIRNSHIDLLVARGHAVAVNTRHICVAVQENY